MRVLVIGNRGDSDPGFIGRRFEELGASLDPWERELDEWPPPEELLAGVDHLVLLGSEWSVYWPEHAGPVERESQLARAAVAAGVPVLGICYGAQLLAHALGGAVGPAATPEIGWYTVDPVGDHPLHAVLTPGPWMQWHSDVIDPPPGAAVLARSPVGVQAWTSPGVLAVQFHPEVTPTMVEQWSDGSHELVEFRPGPGRTPRTHRPGGGRRSHPGRSSPRRPPPDGVGSPSAPATGGDLEPPG
ncbi:MAG: gamma-glutamyl-gamma-aminobutyrate hydrolase family protein [Ilumatobacteraceae bacterium]